MPVVAVGLCPTLARLRKTVSAAINPTGVMLMPLYLIVVGPVSSAFFASACSVATVALRASLLAFKLLTAELSITALDFASAVVFAASVALWEASMARALAAAAGSAPSASWRARL